LKQRPARETVVKEGPGEATKEVAMGEVTLEDPPEVDAAREAVDTNEAGAAAEVETATINTRL